MKRTATIDYHGVPLVCEFDYYRGFPGDRIDPPEPELAEFYSIKAGAVEIYSIFTDDQLGEIETACIEWVHADNEYQECERADMLRKERAERPVGLTP